MALEKGCAARVLDCRGSSGLVVRLLRVGSRTSGLPNDTTITADFIRTRCIGRRETWQAPRVLLYARHDQFLGPALPRRFTAQEPARGLYSAGEGQGEKFRQSVAANCRTLMLGMPVQRVGSHANREGNPQMPEALFWRLLEQLQQLHPVLARPAKCRSISKPSCRVSTWWIAACLYFFPVAYSMVDQLFPY